jgi:hypothetical protein
MMTIATCDLFEVRAGAASTICSPTSRLPPGHCLFMVVSDVYVMCCRLLLLLDPHLREALACTCFAFGSLRPPLSLPSPSVRVRSSVGSFATALSTHYASSARNAAPPNECCAWAERGPERQAQRVRTATRARKAEARRKSATAAVGVAAEATAATRASAGARCFAAELRGCRERAP